MDRLPHRSDGGARIEKPLRWGVALLAWTVVASCASFKRGVEISSGRQALLRGDYAEALPKFQRAAQLEPGYVTKFTPFPENVWTYIGRSYYGLGDLENARPALDRSVEQHPGAILGHIYLGIVQMRQGEVPDGLANGNKGLTLLKGWFQVLDGTSLYSCYWDPGNQIRNGTATLLEQIEAADTSWQKIARDLDWLGKEMEREIDLAARDIDLNRFRWCR